MSYDDYLDGREVILTVATTDGVHGKDANPNLPEQPGEIAADVQECEKLGASIVHVHGRDEHGENDASRLQAVNDAIRQRCDDVVIQNTTGGQGPYAERVLGIRTDPPPEMASLDLGPFKRGRHIITDHTRDNIDRLAREMQERGIKPELEVFNSGQLREVYRLAEAGLIDEPYYVNLIFGGRAFTRPPTPERPQHGRGSARRRGVQRTGDGPPPGPADDAFGHPRRARPRRDGGQPLLRAGPPGRE